MPLPQEKLKTDNSAMKFKAKLRKIGNSQGIYIPLKVITDYTIGDEIELEVITSQDVFDEKVITKVETFPKVITSAFSASSRFELCPKHKGSMKATCGCK